MIAAFVLLVIGALMVAWSFARGSYGWCVTGLVVVAASVAMGVTS